MTLADRFQLLLDISKLSKSHFAKKIGITPSLLSSVINNKQKTIQPMTARTIAKSLNINVEWLEEGKGEMYTDSNIVGINWESEDVYERECKEYLKQKYNLTDEEYDLLDFQLTHKQVRGSVCKITKSIKATNESIQELKSYQLNLETE